MTDDPIIENVAWAITHNPLADEVSRQRALEALAKWEKINSDHHNEKRVFDRYSYFTPIVVRMMRQESVDDDADEVEKSCICFQLWARNISRSGLSCLAFRELSPIVAVEDTSAVVYVDGLLEMGMHVEVQLPRESEDEIVMRAKIVRARQLIHGIHEFGFKYDSRSDSDDS